MKLQRQEEELTDRKQRQKNNQDVVTCLLCVMLIWQILPRDDLRAKHSVRPLVVMLSRIIPSQLERHAKLMHKLEVRICSKAGKHHRQLKTQ